DPRVAGDLVARLGDLLEEREVLRVALAALHRIPFLDRAEPGPWQLVEEAHAEQGEAHPQAAALLDRLGPRDLRLEVEQSLRRPIDHRLATLTLRPVQAAHRGEGIDALVQLQEPVGRWEIVLFE